MAIGALVYCRRAGPRVPEDVSVLGFDDLPLASLLTPSLTTVRQPARELGMEAAKLLLDLEDCSAPAEPSRSPVSLKIRESAGPGPPVELRGHVVLQCESERAQISYHDVTFDAQPAATRRSQGGHQVGPLRHTVPMDEELPPQIEAIRARIPERWGKWIDVSPGWFPLLADLDAQLSCLDPGYVVHQCKSKFGGLRFYVETTLQEEAGEEFANLIHDAEAASETRCEECGADARLVDIDGWTTTLCAEHELAARTTPRS